MSKTVLIVVLVIVALICCVVCSLTGIAFYIANDLSSNKAPTDSSALTYGSVAECSLETNTVCSTTSTGIYSTGVSLIGSDLKLQGVVTKVDASGLAYDAPLKITVLTDDSRNSITVFAPSGFDVCEFTDESRGTAFNLSVGDKVEFRGAVNEGNEITMCDAAHYIKILN